MGTKITFDWLTYALQNVVQYSTVQYSAVQCSAVQYSAVQYSKVQYSTVPMNMLQPRSAVLLNSLNCQGGIRLWLIETVRGTG